MRGGAGRRLLGCHQHKRGHDIQRERRRPAGIGLSCHCGRMCRWQPSPGSRPSAVEQARAVPQEATGSLATGPSRPIRGTGAASSRRGAAGHVGRGKGSGTEPAPRAPCPRSSAAQLSAARCACSPAAVPRNSCALHLPNEPSPECHNAGATARAASAFRRRGHHQSNRTADRSKYAPAPAAVKATAVCRGADGRRAPSDCQLSPGPASIGQGLVPGWAAGAPGRGCPPVEGVQGP